MSFRRLGHLAGVAALFGLALTGSAAVAQPVAPPPAGEPPLHVPPPPGSEPPVAMPDVRPVWHDSAPLTSAASRVDPRAREAWLWECRRRTTGFHDHGRHHRRHKRDADLRPAYDYCEAYFDDYYRAYAQPAYGPAQVMYQPAPTAAPPTTEEIIEYVPVRSRSIPPRRRLHRPSPDKRIKLY